jgi:hypothetical protein
MKDIFDYPKFAHKHPFSDDKTFELVEKHLTEKGKKDIERLLRNLK